MTDHLFTIDRVQLCALFLSYPIKNETMWRGVYLLIAIFVFTINFALSQACCSGGVPVSSNLGLPASAGKTLQVSLSYDLNALNTLKTGAVTEDSRERERTTHSGLLELGYSFSDKFSVDAFFAIVRQERFIRLSNDLTYTQGIGDAVLLLKYNLYASIDQSTSLLIGAGPKFPLGATDKNSSGAFITPNLDLQPGSGAWDLLLWGQFAHALPLRPSLSLIATTIYSYRGVNSEHQCANGNCNTYQFGQEFQAMVGLSDRLLMGKNMIDPSILLRYRIAGQDVFNNGKRPGTGGNFLLITPSVAFWLGSNTSFNFNLELPLYSNVRDTQAAPTYRLTAGIYHRLSFAKSSNNIFSNATSLN